MYGYGEKIRSGPFKGTFKNIKYIICKHIFQCIMIDTRGVIYKGRKEGMNKYKERHACETELRTLEEAIKGADIFIGVSSADLLTNDMVHSMNEKPVIFGNY